MSIVAEANLHRFDGIAEVYETHRPKPPAALTEFLQRYAQVLRPVVVDLGSGTGLSTRAWQGIAARVIGIEPNADMREQARARERERARARAFGTSGGTEVAYRDATSDRTGLADGYADLVTCGQSLHWMEPEPTLREAGRLLRTGGVFAAYDCDWPPALHPDVDAAYAAFDAKVRSLEKDRPSAHRPRQWAKHEHLDRMARSGQFRYIREVLFDSIEPGDAARVIGLARGQGGCSALLKEGVQEEELGLTQLCATASRVLAGQTVPFHFSYRVRIGVK